jgi:hypothetical protein
MKELVDVCYICDLGYWAESLGVLPSTMFRPEKTRKTVEYELRQTRNLKEAERNFDILKDTEISELAFEVLCDFRLEKLKDENASIGEIVKFRNELSENSEHRLQANHLIISVIDSPSELDHATRSSGILFKENYDKDIFNDRMRKVCVYEFDLLETAAQVSNILDSYLAFEKGAKSQDYIYGICRFIEFFKNETKSANNTNETKELDILLLNRKSDISQIDKELYPKLEKRLIGKCIGICKRDMNMLFGKTGFEKLEILATLYSDLRYVDTPGANHLLKEMCGQSRGTCEAILMLATRSKEALKVKSILKYDSRELPGLFDSKLYGRACELNERMSRMEIRSLLGLTFQQMGEWLSENLNEYGDPGHYNNLNAVENFYHNQLTVVAQDNNAGLILDIINSIPVGFRGESRRSLVNYADELIDTIYLKAVESAKTIEETELAIAKSKPGSESEVAGKNKIDRLCIEIVNGVKEFKDIGTAIDHKYRTPAVMDAIAIKTFELIEGEEIPF